MHITYRKYFGLNMSRYGHTSILPFAVLSLPPPPNHRTNTNNSILAHGGGLTFNTPKDNSS